MVFVTTQCHWTTTNQRKKRPDVVGRHSSETGRHRIRPTTTAFFLRWNHLEHPNHHTDWGTNHIFYPQLLLRRTCHVCLVVITTRRETPQGPRNTQWATVRQRYCYVALLLGSRSVGWRIGDSVQPQGWFKRITLRKDGEGQVRSGSIRIRSKGCGPISEWHNVSLIGLTS